MFQPAANSGKSSPILRENYELLWTSVKHGMISGMISDMTVSYCGRIAKCLTCIGLAPQMKRHKWELKRSDSMWFVLIWATFNGSMNVAPTAPKLLLRFIFGVFWLYYDRTVSRQEAKWEIEGGRDWEWSTSRDSNLGCPRRNNIICYI